MAARTHPVGNCQSRGSAHTCLASHNGPIVPKRARRKAACSSLGIVNPLPASSGLQGVPGAGGPVGAPATLQ